MLGQVANNFFAWSYQSTVFRHCTSFTAVFGGGENGAEIEKHLNANWLVIQALRAVMNGSRMVCGRLATSLRLAVIRCKWQFQPIIYLTSFPCSPTICFLGKLSQLCHV